jgi:class 3 adenylate cyclase
MIKSLRQRLFLFLLLPVALLLFAMGFVGFILAKATMLDEWREAAILKLQRAAHHMDMRLSRPRQWMEMFHKTGGYRGNAAIQQWILDRLKDLEGVTKVDLEWVENSPEPMPMQHHGSRMDRTGMMRFHRARISEVTSPHFDTRAGEATVSLISDLKDESGGTIGRLEVSLRFSYLMQDITQLGWWQSDLACLVDKSGRYLAHTEAWMKGRNYLGEMHDPLEMKVLEAIGEKAFGTALGSGHPPDMVGGFYRISQAPWVVILFAPGEEILAPIVRFRNYFALAGIVCIAVIVLLIRFVGERMVASIRGISHAAEQVAAGNYGKPLPIKSADELGQLAESFNTMVEGLKERDFISNTFGRYVDEEIAKALLNRPEAARLGGEKREVAILMSDLQDFTPMSETLSPEETIKIINRYFSRMIEIVRDHGGIIVDFFGDALLVFFDPLDGPVEPVVLKAVECALAMQNEMDSFNTWNRQEGLPELQMRIGVNSGEVVVGNIGSESRAKYGIVGSPVNLTHRIQTVAEAGEVVISESAHRYAEGKFAAERLTDVKLKGVKERENLYVVKSHRN